MGSSTENKSGGILPGDGILPGSPGQKDPGSPGQIDPGADGQISPGSEGQISPGSEGQKVPSAAEDSSEDC